MGGSRRPSCASEPFGTRPPAARFALTGPSAPRTVQGASMAATVRILGALIAGGVACSGQAAAAERVVFRDGREMRCSAHRIEGRQAILDVDGGTVALPADMVERFDLLAAPEAENPPAFVPSTAGSGPEAPLAPEGLSSSN